MADSKLLSRLFIFSTRAVYMGEYGRTMFRSCCQLSLETHQQLAKAGKSSAKALHSRRQVENAIFNEEEKGAAKWLLPVHGILKGVLAELKMTELQWDLMREIMKIRNAVSHPIILHTAGSSLAHEHVKWVTLRKGDEVSNEQVNQALQDIEQDDYTPEQQEMLQKIVPMFPHILQIYPHIVRK